MRIKHAEAIKYMELSYINMRTCLPTDASHDFHLDRSYIHYKKLSVCQILWTPWTQVRIFMSHYDEEIDKSLWLLHVYFLYARDMKSHSSYDVLFGSDGKPIIAKTARIEITQTELILRYENLGYIMWFLTQSLYCGATQVYFHSTESPFSADNQKTLIKFTPNVWLCHTHKILIVALVPLYGSALFVFCRTQNYYI